MTTPQDYLYRISERTQKILQLLEGYSRDEDDESNNIFESVKVIESGMTEFKKSVEILEDKMNLIIKLLGKGKRKMISPQDREKCIIDHDKLIYKPPWYNPEAQEARMGCKFSNDIVLLESFFIKQNIQYEQSDLEETPFGLGHRIKRDTKDKT